MSKKYYKSALYSVRPGATPTKERRRQNGGVRAEIVRVHENGRASLMRRYRAVWECPLDAYFDKKVISEPEYRAGHKFREAYFKAVLSKGAMLERLNIGGICHARLTVSRKLLKQAYEKLSPYYRGVIIDICGHDLPARDTARLEGLKNGLSQLSILWKAAAWDVTGH